MGRLAWAAGARRAGGDRGMTLVELTVVVAIAGLVLAAALPPYGLARRGAARGAALQLGADLRLVRHLAVAWGQVCTLAVAAGDRYRLACGPDALRAVALPPGLRLQAGYGTGLVAYGPDGLLACGVPEAPPCGPDGQGPGETLWVSAGAAGPRWMVRVTPGTGEVVVAAVP